MNLSSRPRGGDEHEWCQCDTGRYLVHTLKTELSVKGLRALKRPRERSLNRDDANKKPKFLGLLTSRPEAEVSGSMETLSDMAESLVPYYCSRSRAVS